ncbi:MAG: hypothetical protein K2L21_06785 [Muribaculaceae bacterium]|nr:hypothetical protein [Muribaculaceae bacterium]
MKINQIHILASAMLSLGLAACSQDAPEQPSQSEIYDRGFVKEFGVPAAGHSYATAVRAGLRVTTNTTARVLVTAEVDGKEYRFAHVTLSPGTHSLPITVPAGVERVKIKTGLSETEAGVNDLVDLDELAGIPSGRGWDLRDENPDVNVALSFTVNDDEAPVLTFRPEDFLNEYFAAHPVGQESTDFWYLGCDTGDGTIDPWISDDIHVYYGETGLGATDLKYDNGAWGFGSLEYMIFPLWWRADNDGNKDYQLKIVQYDSANNGYLASFNDVEGMAPFPALGYSTEEISPEDVLARKADFTYDDGSFTQAYDPATARTVVTEGLKVNFTYDPYDQTAIRMDLRSGSGNSNYSSTVPYWNNIVWGGKYFDVSLKHLIHSTVSTMQLPLQGRNFEVLNYRVNNNEGQSDPRYCDLPIIVGFNSAPSRPGDTAARDYTNLILLVLPTRGLELLYNIQDLPEPYPWTVAAEDLGATDDWDFNDAVLHVYEELADLNTVNRNNSVTMWSGTNAAEPVRVFTVEPVATGGTLPIYVTFTGRIGKPCDIPDWGDEMFSVVNERIAATCGSYSEGTFILGTEVHKWLGAPNHTTFVNVGDKRQATNAQKVVFAVDPEQDMFYSTGYMDKYGNGALASANNLPLYGFALLVDRENKLQIDARGNGGYVHMPDIQIGKDTYMIGRPDENGTIAPQLLFMGGDWQWPTERTKISDAYPRFNTWLTAPLSQPLWHYYPVTGKITAK